MYQTYKTILTGVVVTGPFLWSSGAIAASEVAHTTIYNLNEHAFAADSSVGAVQQVALQDLGIAPTSPYAQNVSYATSAVQLAGVSPIPASSLVTGFNADVPALETILPGTSVLPPAQATVAQTVYSHPLDVGVASTSLYATTATDSKSSYAEEVAAAVPVVETTSHMPDSRLETALESAASETASTASFYSEELAASSENRGVATTTTKTLLADREEVVSLPSEDIELAQTSEALLPAENAVLIPLESLELAQTTEDTSAQLSDEEIRQQLLTTPNSTTANPTTESELDVLDRRPQPIPSSSFITPNAYGADWGDFYVGSAGTTEDTDNGNDGLDASASLGMGFGNAVDNVGVELNVGIISIDGFAEDGSVGFKVHKLFPRANNLGVAVGWTNPITWGNAERDEDTIYGVVTQRFDLRPNKDNPMPLTTSLGVGTGAFRSTGAIEAGDNTPNIFGSVGVRVIPQVSLVSSWSGRALGLATSAAPFKLPVVFTAGVSDLTDNTEEGTQFVGGLGYSFGF